MDRSIYASKMELSIIEYPGLVKKLENMLETLGGIFKVSQVFCGEAKRLELRYHSQNPFNKAISGEIVSRTGLLISIKIQKLTKKYQLPVFRTEIIGYCNDCLLFDSLCDFQYLPLTKSSTSECVEHVLNYLTPSVVTDTSHFSKPFECLFCIPHIFARSDTSKSNIFRNIAQDDGQNAIFGVLQTCAYNSRGVVVFNMTESIPLRPDNQVVKRMKIKYISDEQLKRVKKLFDDCPIWTRIALLYESGVSNDKLKCIIPSLAFYYSTGPWRTLYVRYGYDPRKDFGSRYYQTFDFRLRFRSGVAELVEKRREANIRKKGRLTEANCIIQDFNYPYLDENKLPRSRQCILRYCDIRMCKIQAMLDKIPTPMTGAKCNERTGWLPVGFDGQIRQVLSNIIKDVMRKYCRK